MPVVTPTGFKLIKHRGCGGRLGFARKNVSAARLLLISDFLDNNGEKLPLNALLRCRCDRCNELIFNPALMFFDD